MYQVCTSTPVNSGERRELTDNRILFASSSNAALPGTAESFGPGLITRRSQVQILPPPPLPPPPLPPPPKIEGPVREDRAFVLSL